MKKIISHVIFYYLTKFYCLIDFKHLNIALLLLDVIEITFVLRLILSLILCCVLSNKVATYDVILLHNMILYYILWNNIACTILYCPVSSMSLYCVLWKNITSYDLILGNTSLCCVPSCEIILRLISWWYHVLWFILWNTVIYCVLWNNIGCYDLILRPVIHIARHEFILSPMK